MHYKKLQTYSKTLDSKKQFRPIQAYIMTNMYPGTYTKSLDDIKKLNHIKKISIVTGTYDIVIKANVKNLGQLHKLTSQLQKINGVEKTNTHIIEKECNPLFNR